MQNTIKKHLHRAAAGVCGVVFTVVLCAQGAFAALEVEQLVPMGDVVGIDICTQGVMVVDVTSVSNGFETRTPAQDAGIQPGDVIIRIGSCPVACAQDVRAAMEGADGSAMPVQISREGRTRQVTVTPCKNADGAYEMGVWLRDALAGMGTLTFYDPESGTFAALGHAINDMDTGALVPVREGNISEADVTDVVSGKPGAPGQLQGVFDLEAPIGTVESNTPQGIFGHLDSGNLVQNRPVLPVAEPEEAELGAAQLLSAVSGELVAYEVEVTRLYSGSEAGDRCMMLQVTDPELLALTGGIVQGMSGSPIVQNGKLIGAVTHVLINDPARGYGIFIENMLNAA